MITVAPAAAQVASMTIDGIALAGALEPRQRAEPNQPRIVLNTPSGRAS